MSVTARSVNSAMSINAINDQSDDDFNHDVTISLSQACAMIDSVLVSPDADDMDDDIPTEPYIECFPLPPQEV